MADPPHARLTRRGLALIAVVVAGVALASLHGARSLGAVVIPGVVALLAGLVQVELADPPALVRDLPRTGVRGETATVRFDVRGDGSVLGTLRDTLPAGIDGDPTVTAAFGDAPASYEARYRDRGVHEVGPARMAVGDVLGLVRRRFEVAGTDSVTVYPRAEPLSPEGRHRVLAMAGTGEATEREEFDRLREYVHGDTLRDIHWKASAKRDDLVVTEYTADDIAERVTIHAGAAGAGGIEGETPADAMAEATASVALALLSAGIPVTVRTPDGEVAVDGDRRRLLAHLARADAGEVDAPERPAVAVYADAAGVRVRLGDEETTFAALRGDGAAVDAAAATEVEA